MKLYFTLVILEIDGCETQSSQFYECQIFLSARGSSTWCKKTCGYDVIAFCSFQSLAQSLFSRALKEQFRLLLWEKLAVWLQGDNVSMLKLTQKVCLKEDREIGVAEKRLWHDCSLSKGFEINLCACNQKSRLPRLQMVIVLDKWIHRMTSDFQFFNIWRYLKIWYLKINLNDFLKVWK